MYILEEMENLSRIEIKKSNYISIFSDDMKILQEICDSFYLYFSEKRVISDKKIRILDYRTGEKEKISSKFPIYLSDNSIEEEVEMGSKTILYKRILDFMKEQFPMEPAFSTLNIILDNFLQEEITESLKKDISRYSEYKVDFKIAEFTPNDFIKKIELRYFSCENEIDFKEISNLEKLKIKISIYENSKIIGEREKIYIFYLPENNLSLAEIKSLKKFLLELSERATVIVATNSKYLLADELSGINIIKEAKLINRIEEDKLKKEFIQNYPTLPEWTAIERKLLYLIKNYLLENLDNLRVTNKLKNEMDEISLSSLEDIFILLFYAKLLNLEAILDLEYDNHCVFSNYLEKNLKTRKNVL